MFIFPPITTDLNVQCIELLRRTVLNFLKIFLMLPLFSSFIKMDENEIREGSVGLILSLRYIQGDIKMMYLVLLNMECMTVFKMKMYRKKIWHVKMRTFCS